MTDLCIGLAANYDWPAIEPFATSLARSGYAGKKVLLVKDISPLARQNLAALGFDLVEIPVIEFSNPSQPLGRYFPYVGRFLLIHKYLESHFGYRFVICCDTRDVIFQGNPSKWLEKNIGDAGLVAAPEYLLHRDQSGNVDWVNKGFKEISSWMLPKMIYCSGVIAGRAQYISDVSMGIYLLGRDLSDRLWGADQPVYNTLMHQKAYQDITLVPKMSDHWCVNLVALSNSDDREKMLDWPEVAPFDTHGQGWVENLSILWNSGIPDLSRFTILHQYDRIRPFAEVLRNEYCLANLNRPPLRFEVSTF